MVGLTWQGVRVFTEMTVLVASFRLDQALPATCPALPVIHETLTKISMELRTPLLWPSQK
jgi:hypothetical protein